MKKLLLFIAIFIIFCAGLGLYGALKYRASLRESRTLAKVPEQSITLIEGWDNSDIAAYLDKQNIVPAADFLNAVKTFDLSKFQNNIPKEAAGSLEGFLFPDTYFIFKNTPSGTTVSEMIINKALDNFTQKITPQMLTQAQKDNMSLYQIIILASIIEKETGRNVTTAEQKTRLTEERKIISGIFYNRLKAGVPLQSDATVNFVTGKNDPSASLEDTQIDSPYNTYKFRGLPPGPIANPSLSSIMAALYPTASNYLYFLSDPTTGDAVYAATYEEHLKNKQKYLK